MIRYFKAEPSEFVRISVGGKTKAEGQGISDFYLPHRTSFELVTIATVEQPFALEIVTEDKQPVTLQGGVLYKVDDPAKAFSRYSFAIDPKNRKYLSDDPRKLPEHIVELVRKSARRIVQGTKLEEVVVRSEEISHQVTGELATAPFIGDLGLHLGLLYFSAITPTPEISKALGAEYREALLKRADTAQYDRRAHAVERERSIKENELKNAIQLEEKRKELVALEGENRLAVAQTRARAEELRLAPFAALGAEVLRAQALYELGRNAARIGNLTITPEILAALGSK